MKLFKLIASRAGQVLFDDRVEADSPREAREQMKALMGLNSLTGVVYAITEIPVELIQSIVDARLVEALQRLRGGQAPATVEQMLRPIASEAVREQLATLRTVQAAEAAPPATPQRFDAFTPAVDQIIWHAHAEATTQAHQRDHQRHAGGLESGEAVVSPHRFHQAGSRAV
jgi:hypothetical protein